ncbi:Uncharacterised protein [Vibrio cholerae]|nr:Uncharacterised protein [Vibrio cholerae]
MRVDLHARHPYCGFGYTRGILPTRNIKRGKGIGVMSIHTNRATQCAAYCGHLPKLHHLLWCGVEVLFD